MEPYIYIIRTAFLSWLMQPFLSSTYKFILETVFLIGE